jgi:hypothetical protein
MSCQQAVYQWTEVVTTHLPQLSKPQGNRLTVGVIDSTRRERVVKF